MFGEYTSAQEYLAAFPQFGTFANFVADQVIYCVDWRHPPESLHPNGHFWVYILVYIFTFSFCFSVMHIFYLKGIHIDILYVTLICQSEWARVITHHIHWRVIRKT